MKSLLVSAAEFPPQTGGISRYMASVCEALGRDEVCCLTGVPRNDACDDEHSPRVYRRPRAFAKARHVQAMSLGTAVFQILMKEHLDVVQIAVANEGNIGLWLKRHFGLPFVVYAHGNEILNATRSEWAKPRHSLRGASRVLAVSRYTAALVQEAGVSPERIVIVHPGCDVEQFRPHTPNGGLRNGTLAKERLRRPLILSVGNLVSRKGHDMVIRALPRLLATRGDLTYLIVGDGPFRQELERLAFEVGVRKHVIFAGRVSDEELPEMYALCDVFVMASREKPEACDVEGFGMVYLEAGATGKPVVAGRSGGVGDAVVDGETGVLVDPLCPDAIASSIEMVLKNPDLAIRMGNNGRQRAVREFSWPAVGKRLRTILRDVVEEERRTDLSFARD